MGDESSSNIELGKTKPSASDEAWIDDPPSVRRKHRRLTICCGACCAIFLLILVIVIILAFTLFKPKNPNVDVENVTLENFKFNIALNIPPTLTVNVTLGLVISLHNPNRISFTYTNSTSHIFYRDVEVGLIPVPAGRVGGRGTEQFSSSLDLMADRLISNSHIISDSTDGSLPFSTSTRIRGKVNILNIYKPHITASSLCNFSISISNQSISDMVCAYHLKL